MSKTRRALEVRAARANRKHEGTPVQSGNVGTITHSAQDRTPYACETAIVWGVRRLHGPKRFCRLSARLTLYRRGSFQPIWLKLESRMVLGEAQVKFLLTRPGQRQSFQIVASEMYRVFVSKLQTDEQDQSQRGFNSLTPNQSLSPEAVDPQLLNPSRLRNAWDVCGHDAWASRGSCCPTAVASPHGQNVEASNQLCVAWLLLRNLNSVTIMGVYSK